MSLLVAYKILLYVLVGIGLLLSVVQQFVVLIYQIFFIIGKSPLQYSSSDHKNLKIIHKREPFPISCKKIFVLNHNSTLSKNMSIIRTAKKHGIYAVSKHCNLKVHTFCFANKSINQWWVVKYQLGNITVLEIQLNKMSNGLLCKWKTMFCVVLST